MSPPGDRSNFYKGSTIPPFAEIPVVEITGPRSSSAKKSPLSADPEGLDTYGTSPSLLYASRPLQPGSEEYEQRERLKGRFVSPAASVRSRGSSGGSTARSAHSSRRGSDAYSDTLFPELQAPEDPTITNTGSSSKLRTSSLRTTYHSQPGSWPASPVRRGRGQTPRDQYYWQYPDQTGPSLQLGRAQHRRASFSERAPEHRSFSRDNLAQKGEHYTAMHLGDTVIKHLRKPGTVDRGTMALYYSHLDAKLFEAGQYQLSRDQRARLTTMIGAVRDETASLGVADTTPLSPEDTEHALDVWRDFRRSMAYLPVLSDSTPSGDLPAQSAPQRASSTARRRPSPRSREPQMIPMQATHIKRREERKYKDHYMENCWEASWLSDLATRAPSPSR